MASGSELAAFLDRQTLLLKRERDAEIERTSLLLSSCGPKLLERKGLALGALGVASIRIGLGGKRSALLYMRVDPYRRDPVLNSLGGFGTLV